MNGSIVFLVVWLHIAPVADGEPAERRDPVAQFVSSFHSMKECTAVVERMEAKDKGLKGRVSCLHVVASPSDESESI